MLAALANLSPSPSLQVVDLLVAIAVAAVSSARCEQVRDPPTALSHTDVSSARCEQIFVPYPTVFLEPATELAVAVAPGGAAAGAGAGAGGQPMAALHPDRKDYALVKKVPSNCTMTH